MHLFKVKLFDNIYYYFAFSRKLHDANNGMETGVTPLTILKQNNFNPLFIIIIIFLKHRDKEVIARTVHCTICISDLIGLFSLKRRAGLGPARFTVVSCGSHSTRISVENLIL